MVSIGNSYLIMKSLITFILFKKQEGIAETVDARKNTMQSKLMVLWTKMQAD